MSEPGRPGGVLPEPARRVHRALLEALLGDGTVPPPEALADRFAPRPCRRPAGAVGGGVARGG